MKKITNKTAQLERTYFTNTVDTPALAGVNLRVAQGGYVVEHAHKMSKLCDGQATTNRLNSTTIAVL